MSSPAADQDHSIEEILASIRQIISEDDQKSTAEPMASVALADDTETRGPVDLTLPPDPVDAPYNIPADPLPAPDGDFSAPLPGADPAVQNDDDVFELVDRMEDTAPALESSPAPAPVPDMSFDLPPLPPAPPVPVSGAGSVPGTQVGSSLSDQIFTDVATSATLGAFSKLSETILMERKRAIEGASITLDDVVKDLLRPLLREWIDQHMPDIVDRLVREELEKITRQARER